MIWRLRKTKKLPDIEIVKTHEFYATIIPFNMNRKVLSNLNGSLSHKSSRGNLDVMVIYDYDSFAIIAKPIKIGGQQPSAIIFSRCTRY